MYFRRTPDAGNKCWESLVSGPAILARITKNEHLRFTQGADESICQKIEMSVPFLIFLDINVKLANRVRSSNRLALLHKVASTGAFCCRRQWLLSLCFSCLLFYLKFSFGLSKEISVSLGNCFKQEYMNIDMNTWIQIWIYLYLYTVYLYMCVSICLRHLAFEFQFRFVLLDFIWIYIANNVAAWKKPLIYKS